jgi:hypothetical protein
MDGCHDIARGPIRGVRSEMYQRHIRSKVGGAPVSSEPGTKKFFVGGGGSRQTRFQGHIKKNGDLYAVAPYADGTKTYYILIITTGTCWLRAVKGNKDCASDGAITNYSEITGVEVWVV